MRRLIPDGDKSLARRLRRQLMGVASYLMFLLPMAYAVVHGWMDFDWRGLALVGLVALAINVFFFRLIRSGRTARFRDPSLTFAQVACALGLALVTIHFANEARGMLLMLFVASLFFGVFGLTRGQFLFLSAATASGYLLLSLWEHHGEPWDSPEVRLEGLRLLTLAMILGWLGLMGSYVGHLRARLERRNAELGEAMAKLRAVASHDELTGVHNRRHLLGVLDKEKERSDRFGQTFSIGLLDLDRFKQVNDTHGHAAGDDVLRGFAGRMLASARRMDWVGRGEKRGLAPGGAEITGGGAAAAPESVEASLEGGSFGRFGGEEFLLVLPQTTLAGAVRCVDRLRERTSASPFDTVAGPLVVTFSAGIAEYRRGEPVAELLARADAALYRAKDAGRDRTEFAD